MGVRRGLRILRDTPRLCANLFDLTFVWVLHRFNLHICFISLSCSHFAWVMFWSWGFWPVTNAFDKIQILFMCLLSFL